MKEKDRPEIEKFIQGKMSSAELQAFQKEMAADADLAAEVSFRADVAKAIRRKKLLTQMTAELKEEGFFAKEGEKEAKTIPLKNRRIRLSLQVAAAISLLVLIGSFWYANKNFSNPQLAFMSFEDIRALGLTDPPRGEHQLTLSTLKEATKNLEQNKYNSAIEKLRKIPDSDPIYELSQLYLGHALFLSQNYVEAMATITALVANASNSLVKQKAEWTLINGLLKQDQTDDEFHRRLNQIIANRNHQFYKQAVTLQKKLNSGWRRLAF